jgi:hypothetical protein
VAVAVLVMEHQVKAMQLVMELTLVLLVVVVEEALVQLVEMLHQVLAVTVVMVLLPQLAVHLLLMAVEVVVVLDSLQTKVNP